MKPIAQSLTSALSAAGLPVEGVSLGDHADKTTWRVVYTSAATEADKALGASIVAAFDSSTVVTSRQISTRDFFRRWTKQERAKVRSAGRQNDDVADLSEELRSGSTVDLTSPLLLSGLRSLKAVLIPSVWANDTVAETRIAELIA